MRIEIEFLIPEIHESLVISASQPDPATDRRNEAKRAYRAAWFSRDDQFFHTLDTGINAEQREGGDKSLEIRRFGFNLDHRGVNPIRITRFLLKTMACHRGNAVAGHL